MSAAESRSRQAPGVAADLAVLAVLRATNIGQSHQGAAHSTKAPARHPTASENRAGSRPTSGPKPAWTAAQEDDPGEFEPPARPGRAKRGGCFSAAGPDSAHSTSPGVRYCREKSRKRPTRPSNRSPVGRSIPRMPPPREASLEGSQTSPTARATIPIQLDRRTG